MLHFTKPSEMASTPEGESLLNDIIEGRDVVLVVDDEEYGLCRITGMVDRVEDGYVYLHNSEDPEDPIGYDFSIIESIEATAQFTTFVRIGQE
jgi:hypothetical protein